MSIDKPLIAANLIVGQTSTPPQQKNVAINSLVNALPQPGSIASSSIYSHQIEQQPIKQAQRMDPFDDSIHWTIG